MRPLARDWDGPGRAPRGWNLPCSWRLFQVLYMLRQGEDIVGTVAPDAIGDAAPHHHDGQQRDGLWPCTGQSDGFLFD